MLKPKKQLGQHFLIQPQIAQRIVNLLPFSEEHLIVEIGPGKGILTQFLLQKNNPIIALDIDKEAIDYLTAHFSAKNLTIFHQDILNYDFPNTKIFLIGNLPYNISSPIFFHLLDNYEKIDFAVVMVQREVAERITAKTGHKAYGILSIFLGIYYDCKIAFHVKPGAFFPPPKVNSSVITLEKKQNIPFFDKKKLFHIVKTSFQQRRKMLSNSLKNIIPNLPDKFKSKRPEQLSIQDFIEISEY